MREGLDETLGRVAANFDPTMVIVTVTDGRERAGCLIQFSSQCSIHPFRYWVAVSSNNHTFATVSRAETLAVHMPSASQRELASLFGETCGKERDKFEQVRWHPWRDGTPILGYCATWFVGPIVLRTAFGDHVGVVLEPVDAVYRGPFTRLALSAVSGFTAAHPP